jgi:hypothetical protein
LSAYAAAHAELAHERVEDEVIVINLRTGTYFSLVGTAADAWDLLLAGAPLEDVAAGVAHRYGAEVPDVQRDLDAFVTSLVDEELLVVADSRTALGSFDDLGAAAERTYHPPMLEKYDDMEELLLLDPIHEVDESGWPVVAAEPVDG